MNYLTKKTVYLSLIDASKAFDKVELLKQLNFVCHVGVTYAGAFGYVNDIALILPSLLCLKKLISLSNICRQICIRESKENM